MLRKISARLTSAKGRRVSRWPLRRVLAVAFLIQILLAVSFTGWLSLRDSHEATARLAGQLQGQVTQRVEQHLDSYLRIPHLINQTNQDALALGWLDPNDLASLERHFWQQMQVFPEAGFIYYANAAGDLIGVERLDSGELQIDVI
ncbi:MAG: hybrid sensor histidine kinase/response regulator, partial [Spirulinaceae cyanobacterium RM2_2_10]|nr:hybrid sensor histidine kinase/response regulator [Spirulinaceae cyanobacterium RM2_2_10]